MGEITLTSNDAPKIDKMGTDLVRIYLLLAIELKVFPYLSRLKVCGTREGSTPGRKLSTRMGTCLPLEIPLQIDNGQRPF